MSSLCASINSILDRLNKNNHKKSVICEQDFLNQIALIPNFINVNPFDKIINTIKKEHLIETFIRNFKFNLIKLDEQTLNSEIYQIIDYYLLKLNKKKDFHNDDENNLDLVSKQFLYSISTNDKNSILNIFFKKEKNLICKENNIINNKNDDVELLFNKCLNSHDEKYFQKKIKAFLKKKNTTTFIDGSFQRNETKSIKSIVWLRPKDIQTNSSLAIKWSVYDNPKITDIKQGALGNCWFIAVFALLVQKPEYLDKIILTRDISSAGCYLVRLCINGSWKIIVLDDYLPCYEETKTQMFAKTLKQLWGPMLEKALAKVNGSYNDLESGFCREGII
jgi:hypothetical protein